MIINDYLDGYVLTQMLLQETSQMDDVSLIDEVSALPYEDSVFYDDINDAFNSHFIGERLTPQQRRILKYTYVICHFNMPHAIHPGIL